MFKLFFVYPIVALILVWLASDLDISASVYSFDDNHISVVFPKAAWDIDGAPWFTFEWNADALRDGLNDMSDEVIDAAADLKGEL
ncbi:MAG TPA: hypothetical protein EYH12_00610 [Psychromonas hadalis]|nr:hypothetical protein [Psychromonas hadalis]